MRRHLSQREILIPLLALLDPRTTAGKATSPIYTVGRWVHELGEGEDGDEREERLQIGQMAAGWAANVLEDVLGECASLSSLPVPASSLYTHEHDD